MKTRVISGIVAIILLVGLLVANNYWSPISAIAISLLSALASYEMLSNTGAVKNKIAVIIAMVYSFTMIYCYPGILPIPPVAITVFYVIIIAAITLRYFEAFKTEELAMSLSMPIIISYAFSCLHRLLNYPQTGIFLLIMLLNYSSIADCGAYFTGVAIGKHKLAPVISPKKTIEGAVGGVITSVIGTVVICLIFNSVSGMNANLLGLSLITPVMVIIGILGDLFTSAIKRTYGIKDYGKLMPGHGGVLDRCDSILLCAPVLELIVRYMEVVH